MTEQLRNIAIIAHVDHGKTTLIDTLLAETNQEAHKAIAERALDSNELEKERGITITAKNTAISWRNFRINIVDTPGHADFGGEVERILSMVDAVLLLVDAVEGPMPQTRFVTKKAFAHKLKPIVVINKIDRDGARPDWVIEKVFDLFDELGASDEQLDFPVVYASAIQGFATHNIDERTTNMEALLTTMVEHTQPPKADPDGPLQMQISSLGYSSYVGTIGIGKISRGCVTPNMPVTLVAPDDSQRNGRILNVMGYLGLDRFEIEKGHAGDIVAITGIDDLKISETLCCPSCPEKLPSLTVDEPTVHMTFQVNDSPLAGRDGKFLTSRKLLERLQQEALHNVALRVTETSDPDKFSVSGRGELHLSILLETMRREGYELAVSRPEVITKEIDGKILEPFENLTIECDENDQGKIMTLLGERGGELLDMGPSIGGQVRLDYRIPAKSLIGFQSIFLTLTSGSGICHHVFDDYDEIKPVNSSARKQGVLISNTNGKAIPYALFNLQERGRMLVYPGDEVYEGMIIGIHTRENDLVVNPTKTKKLTNVRAAMNDENILISSPKSYLLEEALTFINQDELLEITPKTIRFRKKHLKEHERKRSNKVM